MYESLHNCKKEFIEERTRQGRLNVPAVYHFIINNCVGIKMLTSYGWLSLHTLHRFVCVYTVCVCVAGGGDNDVLFPFVSSMQGELVKSL